MQSSNLPAQPKHSFLVSLAQIHTLEEYLDIWRLNFLPFDSLIEKIMWKGVELNHLSISSLTLTISLADNSNFLRVFLWSASRGHSSPHSFKKFIAWDIREITVNCNNETTILKCLTSEKIILGKYGEWLCKRASHLWTREPWTHEK